MNKTLKISFSLKNTYRVNGILFSLKQIPLLKRLLPATLYKVKGLKIFANILSVLWEIVSAFLGKFLYFVTMVSGIGILYKTLPENEVFLHILLILTVIGSFVNTHLFNPTKDKYYAMILMRMDAREYTLVNYTYNIIKVVIGFLPFTILFGINKGLPLWFCLLLPLGIAGMKLFAAGITLWDYEKRGFGYNENKLSKYVWGVIAFYGLLGPNGAGKSTTLKMLTGMMKPTAGKIYFDGKLLDRKDLSKIGALIENPPIYENLSARENLKVRQLLLGTDENRIDEVLQIVSLTNTGKKKAGQFSLGMKQRLGIAMALLGEPELLILDEPTNGLDPIGIEELRELIRSFPEQGITVILSSHILSEVQLLADKVGIISGGILGYEGALKQGDNLEDLFMNVVRKNQKAGEIHG